MAQQKKDCEETCDYSDAFAAIKQEGLKWERNCVIALSSYWVWFNALFKLAHLVIRLAKYQRMCYCTVDREQQHFQRVKWCMRESVGYILIPLIASQKMVKSTLHYSCWKCKPRNRVAANNYFHCWCSICWLFFSINRWVVWSTKWQEMVKNEKIKSKITSS